MASSFESHPIAQFVHSRYNKSGDAKLTTMTSMGEKKGSWNIKDEEYPAFLDLLHLKMCNTLGLPQELTNEGWGPSHAS